MSHRYFITENIKTIPASYVITLLHYVRKTEALFVLSGGAVGGRLVFGVSGVRPSAMEQSASEAAGLQLGEGTSTKTLFIHTIRLNCKRSNSIKIN